MTDITGERTGASIPQPWLEGQGEPTVPGLSTPAPAGRWYKGMPSPNKAGRPPGITDRKSKLAQRMLADADGIVAALAERALDGDSGAASIILSRVLPPLRSQAEKVAFPFDASAPVARQVKQVLDACASGTVAPDVAKLVIESIKALAEVRAVEELEQRVVLLEARPV